jgi:deoxyribonuclease-4
VSVRFGFHISTAGGFSKVVERARVRQCETIQIFSRNPRGWTQKALDERDVAVFKEELRQRGICPLFVHLPYLPNLATKQTPFYNRSFGVLCEDLRRAETLSASFVIMHMGSGLGTSEDEAVAVLAESINRSFRKVENDVILLLENTSGQGTQIGWRFEAIGAVIKGIDDQRRIGVCLDTAHAFAAGYDVSNRDGLDATLKGLDRFVGLDRLFLVHLNDTKVPLGSHKDRHWHIGRGRIGLGGFRMIVNDPRLSHLPGIMETPRKNDHEDLENMSVIRSLVERGSRDQDFCE